MDDQLENRVNKLISEYLSADKLDPILEKHMYLAVVKRAKQMLDAGKFDKAINAAVYKDIQYEISDGDIIADSIPWKYVSKFVKKTINSKLLKR